MSEREWLERMGRIDADAAPRFLFLADAYGNSVLRWCLALALAALALLLLWLIKTVLARRARRLAAWRPTAWMGVVIEAIEATRGWFLLLMAIYIGSQILVLAPEPVRTAGRIPAVGWTLERVLDSAALIGLLVQAAIWINVLMSHWIQRYSQEKMAADAASVTMMRALGFLGRLVVWAVALLLALENLGVDITAMVAGLGVAGIAVGLAAQNVLGDLFASASIVLDKPFVLGDFIAVDDKMGTVENIGLKTTRLRALGGEELILSNSDLLKSRIHNHKRLRERRVLFTLGVTYQTPHEKLAAIPGMIREIIAAQEQVRFDRAHLQKLGDFALVFEVVYWVLSPDFNRHMDLQQAIYLAIHERFELEQIEFAYPTQTVFMARDAV